jgi:polyhydroxyalkanoate synthesis regulator phasin
MYIDMVRDETQHSISMLKNNPMMKKLVETGEARVGKLVQQLMSNEKFVSGVQSIVGKAFSAKGTLDKSIKGALSAMNLPSTGDLDVLKEKIEELETLLDKLDSKLDALASKK